MWCALLLHSTGPGSIATHPASLEIGGVQQPFTSTNSSLVQLLLHPYGHVARAAWCVSLLAGRVWLGVTHELERREEL